MVKLNDDESPRLPRFYAGREVFITGATGFMGKVLVERLLWTCPDVARVHLLLRDKREQTPLDRLERLKQSEVFVNIRASCPHQLDKLTAVDGDVTLPLLGLHATSIASLKKVTVVLHNAATVKFSEPLAAAVSNNVTSVLHVQQLCEQLPALQVLVHVSTAFSNAELSAIEERVYAAPAKLHHLQALIDALPKDLLDDITPRYISPKPNTYVFSKSMAEALVQQHRARHYSVAIFRPSIVASSYRSPFPGWIEGLSGATGVVVGISQGLIQVFNSSMDVRAEIVPVDVAIDCMLAVAWETAIDKACEARVYNCVSGESAVPWRQFRATLQRTARAHPFHRPLYYPGALAFTNWYLYKPLEFVLQTAPLYAAEYIIKLCGIKTKMSLITASDRISAMNKVLRFFAVREWRFSTDNMRRLADRLARTDGHIYHLDIKKVDWEEHVSAYTLGARRYIMRQSDDTLPQDRVYLNRLRYIHYGVMLTLAMFSYKLLQCAVAAALRKWSPPLSTLSPVSARG